MRSIARQRDRKIPTGGWGSPPLFQSEGSHPDMITRLVFFLSTICCCAQSRARFHFILHCNKLGRREGMAKQGFEAKFSLSVDRSVSQIFNPAKVGLVAIPEPLHWITTVTWMWIPTNFKLCAWISQWTKVDHGPYSVTFFLFGPSIQCLDSPSWTFACAQMYLKKLGSIPTNFEANLELLGKYQSPLTISFYGIGNG